MSHIHPVLVSEYDNSVVSVKSYGNAVQYDPAQSEFSEPLSHIEYLARANNMSDILWQRLPSIHHPDRRFTVLDRGNVHKIHAKKVFMNNHRYDGVILRNRRQSVAFTTRDCPTLILTAGPGSFVAVLHCGRDALQDFNLDWSTESSVIAEAFKTLHTFDFDPTRLCGFVTMGIAAEHFANNRYPEILTGIRNTWGTHVLTGEDSCNIDLLALIRAQLAEYGNMQTSQVEWDGLDTYSNPHLASVRAGHNGYHNLVLATYL